MGKGAHARKRKAQGEPSGSYLKVSGINLTATDRDLALEEEL